jgi:hypothetical protein
LSAIISQYFFTSRDAWFNCLAVPCYSVLVCAFQ